MPKTKELREHDTSHLTAELAEKHKHMFDLRSQAVTEKLEDPSQLGKTRKEIARIKTILRQREIETAARSEKSAEKSAAKSEKSAKAAV